jgi:hypothetical protein
LKKSVAWGRNREHNGIQTESGTQSNCGGNEFFNSLLGLACISHTGWRIGPPNQAKVVLR